MNKKHFLLCKKLFGCINNHQLLNEYVLHNFFAFYQTLLFKITIKVIIVSFWIPNSPTSMVLINSTFIEKTQNYIHHGPPKLQNAINEIQSTVIFIVQKEYHQILTKKSL